MNDFAYNLGLLMFWVTAATLSIIYKDYVFLSVEIGFMAYYAARCWRNS